MFAVAEVTQASPPTTTRQFLTFSHSTFATSALVVSSRSDYLAFFWKTTKMTFFSTIWSFLKWSFYYLTVLKTTKAPVATPHGNRKGFNKTSVEAEAGCLSGLTGLSGEILKYQHIFGIISLAISHKYCMTFISTLQFRATFNSSYTFLLSKNVNFSAAALILQRIITKLRASSNCIDFFHNFWSVIAEDHEWTLKRRSMRIANIK